MEKQLCTVGYWLGLIFTAFALIIWLLNACHIQADFIGPTSSGIFSRLGSLRAAELFFLLSIASWCRTAKS
jgi:hypothetical protein